MAPRCWLAAHQGGRGVSVTHYREGSVVPVYHPRRFDRIVARPHRRGAAELPSRGAQTPWRGLSTNHIGIRADSRVGAN